MILNVILKPNVVSDYVMDTKITQLQGNTDVVNGTFGNTKSSYITIDLAEIASQYHSSDFDIQSILEVGAFNMLKPTYVSTLSSMEFADNIQNLSENVQKS